MNLLDMLGQALQAGGQYGLDHSKNGMGMSAASSPWQTPNLGMFGQPNDPSGTTVNHLLTNPTPGSPQAQQFSQSTYDSPLPTQAQPMQSPPTGDMHHGLLGEHQGLRNLLGGIADALFVGGGGDIEKAPYAKHREEQELSQAMSTFHQDPMGTIQRLIASRPKVGLPLYKDYTSSQREQVYSDNIKQQMEDRTRGNIASLLYSARNDPAAFTKNLAIASNLAKQRGIDASTLPQVYDHDAITQFANGTVPVDKQVDNEANAERLANNKSYRDARLEQIGRNTDSQIQARNVSNFQRAASAGNAATTAQRTADQVTNPSKYRAPSRGSSSTPAPAAKPVKVIRQNGHQFEIYADGSHKYVAGT